MRRIAILAFAILSCAFGLAAQAPNTIKTVAGGGTNPSVAKNAYFPEPRSAVKDSAGNAYISVPAINVVYKVDTSGTLTTYAGNGIGGFSGDGSAAAHAELNFPQGLAIDPNGNLFIADSFNNRVRRVDAQTHLITTVAGSGDPFFGAYAGDGGIATSAQMNMPFAVAVDHSGNLFIADTDNNIIRRLDATTQIITTYAGNGNQGTATQANGDGGPATSAQLNLPGGVAVDSNGNVFIADTQDQVIRKVNTSTPPVISTYAGTGNIGNPGQTNGDGGLATAAQIDQPGGVAVDAAGNVYLVDSGNPRIREVDLATLHINTLVGTGFICVDPTTGCGDGGAALNANLNFPQSVFVDASGFLIADTDNMRVRFVPAGANPTIANFAGGGSVGDGGPATSVILGTPQILTLDGSGNIFTLETNGDRLRRIDATTGTITTYAGNGIGGGTIDTNNGDGGPATSARFVAPVAVATDSSGNFYVADKPGEVIRKINTSTPPGITTIAGNGLKCGAAGNPNTQPACGDGGPATSASVVDPTGVAVDSKGNIFYVDAALNTVRRIDFTTGTISTFAGTPGTSCSSSISACGDGGTASLAQLTAPIGVAFDAQDNLYIADAGNNRIREVDTTGNFTINTVAFTGEPSFGGDGGPALGAVMEFPDEVALDNKGNLFIGGGSDNVVRRVDAFDQSIITVAGDVNNLNGGFSGDGGPSVGAMIGNFGLAIDSSHNLYIGDSGSNRIRKVNLAPVTVQTGTFTAFGPTIAGQVDSMVQEVFFQNNGLDDLILTVTSSGSSAFQLGVNCVPTAALTCVVTIPPQETGDIQVDFAPPAGVAGPLTGNLAVATNDAANPTFNFALSGGEAPPVTLTVTENPAAAGDVFSDAVGGQNAIDCPTTCSASFASGSVVTLTATPNTGFAFTGWNTANAPGASCPGTTTTCSVTMSLSQTVGANFIAMAPGSFVLSVTDPNPGNGTGTVVSAPAGISCPPTCSVDFPASTTSVVLTATATAANGSKFAGWLGDFCSNSGVGPCTVFGFSGTEAVTPVFSGPAQPFVKGQVFLSTDDAMVFVYNPAGTVAQVLPAGTLGGQGGGMTFDSVGNLYLTNLSASAVQTFTNHGAGPVDFAVNVPHPVSDFVDPTGNVFVGQSEGGGEDAEPLILQFAPGSGGSPSNTFFPAYDGTFSPTEWIELLDNNDTVAYTLGGKTMKVFDLSDLDQHADLITTLHGAMALRELPDKSILVADTDRIVRVGTTGNIAQTYTIPATAALFDNLNLDPDGVTFWTNDELTGIVYRINIQSGAVASSFPTSLGITSTVFTNGVGGIAIFGQPQSGGADVSVTMTAAPSPVAQGSNLTYTITVANNGPLSANGVTFTDTLPTGASFVSATTSVGTCSGTATVTCAIGNMNNAATATIMLVVTATQSGTLANTVDVTSTTADPNALNNSATTSTTVTTPGSGTVNVTVTGPGNVTDTANSAKINCTNTAAGPPSGTCTSIYSLGTVVTLTETPAAGASFTTWTGASCTNPTATTCTFTVSSASTPINVSATFAAASGGGLSFTSTTLPAGAVTVPYGADIQIIGGTPPYTVNLANGVTLPAGFTLDSTAGGNAAPGHVQNDAPAATGTFTFGVNVTDSTSPTPLTGNATISLTIAPTPPNTQPGLLKGKYAILLRGFNELSGAEEAIVGSLTFDGAGTIEPGILDVNSTTTVGITQGIATTGSYSIGPDNRGVMTITPAGQAPGVFAFSVGSVLNGVASTAFITSFTDDSGTGDTYAGTLRLQDPTSFNNAAFAGTYVYASSGQDTQSHPVAEIGLTTVNNANGVTSGSADANDDGFAGTIASITGTYTTPDVNGRSLLSLTLNTSPSTVVVYQISANEVIHMTLDARANNVLLVGTAQKQAHPNAFSNASLAGPDVFSLAGISGTQGTSAIIGLLTATQSPTPSADLTTDFNEGGVVQIGEASSGPLSIAASGRGTITRATGNLVFYLTGPDSGFMMTTDATVSTGPIVPQVGAPFSTTPFANHNLFIGQQEGVPNQSSEFSGIATLGAANSLAATDDETHHGGDLFFDQGLGSFTYAVTPAGHFTLTSATQGNSSGYVVSPFETVSLDTTGPASDPGPSIHPHVIIAQSIPAQAAASVTLAPTSLTFNPQGVGTASAAQTVTLTNTGTATLAIDGITVTGTNLGDFAQTHTCSASLAAGANCVISVTFTPAGAGERSAALNVADNATGSPQTVSLSGTGTTAAGTPALSITKSHNGNFEQGQQAAAYTVTVSNGANAAPTTGAPVTVTETVPSGLTLGTMTGTGWTCTANTCTRTDVLANGASYPAIAVTVNVAEGAASPQVNAVAVSGGGSAPASTTDSTVITSAQSGPVPVPLVNQPLVPDAAAPGGAAFTLTVNGTGFVSGAAVDWNGSARTTTFVNARQLTATINAADIAAAKTASVTVVNPGSATSNVAFFTVTTPAASPSSTAATGSPITVGTGPFAIAVGDFKNKGLQDLAIADDGGNSVTILLGNGDGTFTAAATPPGTFSGPDAILVADFNGDGKLDLAVLNGGSNSVTILLGNGDGTFTVPDVATPTTGSNPLSFVAGDFNGDGHMDLVVANYRSNNVTILLGNGDGSFTATEATPATGVFPAAIVAGDFNKDGKLDLAVDNQCGTGDCSAGTVTILLGDGTGNFTPTAASPSTGSGPVSMAVADFNGDGNLDLAIPSDCGASGTCTTNGAVTILLGDGTGNFTASTAMAATGLRPYGIVVGDFNGDGKPDLAIANNDSNTVSVLLGDGTGIFTPIATPLTTGTGPVFPAVGDFNNDGRLDIVVPNSGSNNISVFLAAGGTTPAGTVTLNPTSLTFASQALNTTSPAQTVTVSNTGNVPVGLTGLGITGPFAILSGDGAGTCNSETDLAVEASCTVNVTFTPTAAGSATGVLSVSDNATGSPQTVALSGASGQGGVTITIPPGGSSTATTTPGGTAFYGLTISGAPGVTGTVQLGCVPSSNLITCQVIPSSVILNGGTTQIAFGIQTFCQGTTTTGALLPFHFGGKFGRPLVILIFAGMLWTLQRKRRLAVTFATIMLIALGSAACASLPKGPNGATPAGTYTLTLTTTINGQTQTLQNFLTLVVK